MSSIFSPDLKIRKVKVSFFLFFSELRKSSDLLKDMESTDTILSPINDQIKFLQQSALLGKLHRFCQTAMKAATQEVSKKLPLLQ